ncbi:MAG TPA: NPCBM/NEW2 domain-containing protein [Planctomycetaceae bacterium]|nr:NPCBM/NEW2 domain-containing protein [Planctomycetaceae bacterium]
MACLLSRLIAILCLFWSDNARGADPFEILNRGGIRTPAAVLQELGPEFFRYRTDERDRELATSDLVGFQRVLETKPRSTGGAMLRLVNGDILLGQIAALGDSRLDWILCPEDRAAATRVTIPLEYVLGVSFGLSPPDAMKSLVLRGSQKGADRLKLSNGDELTGDLSELSLEQLSLETETGTTTIPLKTVRTILFNEELTESPDRSPERTLVMLEPGTRITLTDFQISRNSTVSGTTVFGASLELALSQLNAAVLLNSSVQPLSEREPESVEYRSFLSTIPSLRKNSGVRGGPLQIGHRSYLTGLGMQSRTEMSWKIAPSDEFLIADIGLDIEAEQRGSLRFRILLDGEQVFESSELTGGDPPQTIRLDLREKRMLTLIADFGKDGDVLDLGVWGNALILSQAVTSDP